MVVAAAWMAAASAGMAFTSARVALACPGGGGMPTRVRMDVPSSSAAVPPAEPAPSAARDDDFVVDPRPAPIGNAAVVAPAAADTAGLCKLDSGDDCGSEEEFGMGFHRVTPGLARHHLTITNRHAFGNWVFTPPI